LAALILMARLLKSAGEEGAVPREPLLAIAVGVTVAAGCFCRPSWLLAGPLFVAILVVIARKRKRAVVNGLLILGGMTAVFTPWILRNARVTQGKFVLLTLWAGPSLYDGLNPNATGDSEMSFIERDRKYQQLSEYETSRYYQRKAGEFVREHPGRTIRLAGRKLIRFWKPWPNAVQFRRWWIIAVCSVWFALIYVPAILAAWGVRERRLTLLLTLGPVLYFSAIHSVFVGSVRYRLPAEYAVHILSAAGLVFFWDQIKSKSRSAEAGSGSVSGVGSSSI